MDELVDDLMDDLMDQADELVDELGELEQLDHFATALRSTAPALALALTRDDELTGPDLDFPAAWFTEAGEAVTEVFGELSDTERHAVLDVVEMHLHGGTPLVRDCIAMGLLESIAQALTQHRMDGHTLAAHLGVESRTYLDAWDVHEVGHSTLDSA